MGFQTRQRHKKIREIVVLRDGLVCCYCEIPLTRENFTLDHIVPSSKRGTFNATNLTVSCSSCNNKRGSESFFTFCKNFNFTESKILKYRKMYFNNLKIKILNIAKEDCLIEDQAIPIILIEEACHILRTDVIDFSDYQKVKAVEIHFQQLYNRGVIKYNFEKLIRIIDSDTY